MVDQWSVALKECALLMVTEAETDKRGGRVSGPVGGWVIVLAGV